MFRHRQSLRRWAAAVLLWWLFGISAGVAHACLAAGTHGEQMSAPATATATATATTCHAGPADDHATGQTCQGTLSPSSCQTLCGKAGVSMSPHQPALDKLQAHALPPLQLATTGPVSVPMPPPIPLLRRDGVAQTPITITFLRLAL